MLTNRWSTFAHLSEKHYYMNIYIYILMTFVTDPHGECILVSYDVSGSARSVAARVCQIVFGRKRIAHGRARDEPGFIHRSGVAWIGQSVLVMSSHDAEELASRLRPLGVRVAMAPVTIPRTSLEAFQRPRAYHARRRGMGKAKYAV